MTLSKARAGPMAQRSPPAEFPHGQEPPRSQSPLPINDWPFSQGDPSPPPDSPSSVSPGTHDGDSPLRHRRIQFNEGGCTLRLIETAFDRAQVYRLRHEVFYERLRWVPSSPLGLEVDAYDAWALALGVFTEDGSLIATVRILLPDHPFMLETDFAGLVGPEHRIRKAPDTIEISRLAVSAVNHQEGRSSRRTAMLLYKGVYQWSLANEVRYVYMEVEPRYQRALSLAGFPCAPIGPTRRLPPANVESVALLLDWEEFRLVNQVRRAKWLEWMTTIRSISVP